MGKYVRYIISSHTSISQPRVNYKECCVCDGVVYPVGVIMYMLHDTTNLYSWVHIGCLKKAVLRKPTEYGPPGSYEDIFRREVKCSYCDKDTGIKYSLGDAYFHKDCFEKFRKKAEKIFKENESKITAHMI